MATSAALLFANSRDVSALSQLFPPGFRIVRVESVQIKRLGGIECRPPITIVESSIKLTQKPYRPFTGLASNLLKALEPRMSHVPRMLLVVCLGLAVTTSTRSLNANEDGNEQVEKATTFVQETDQLRNRMPRSNNDVTIFTPLTLPTPTTIRNAIGLPGEDYWQQQADYVIDCTLDPANDSLKAEETISYTNNSPTDLPYVWVILEQNLFAPDSEGSKFTPPGSRFNNRQKFDGGYKIDFVRVNGKDVELNAYGTVGRIDLPEPIKKQGGTVEIEIGWSFNIPEYGVDRMGIKRVEMGKIFEMAQWFPAICKFDDVHGWNTLPYLGQGEFYTDFGSYDVTIRSPRSHVVCATGILQNPIDVMTAEQLERISNAVGSTETVMIRSEEEVGDLAFQTDGNDLAAWRFKADKVRTFAWTSSDATIWDAAGITWEDGSHTLVQSVYPAELKENWSQSTQMLRHSILHYSDKWFRYPYPSATNVHGVCGGMEYPMIIFCGGRSERGLFSVTSHEIGHTWFPMVVNTDERRNPWMDEGFNTFINGYDTFTGYQAAMSGAEPSVENLFPGQGRSGRRRSRRPTISQPIAIAADQIRPNLLGRLAYAKPAEGLRILREKVVGPDRFDAAFKTYIREWAFKSPQPSDFYRCMENGAGMNLAWFWRGWYLEDTLLDQAVHSVTIDEEDQTAVIALANHQEMVMPVWLTIVFEDGSSKEVDLPVYVWHYTNLWTTQVSTDGKTISKIIIDEDGALPDVDRDNNEWTRPEDESDTEGDSDDDDSDEDN